MSHSYRKSLITGVVATLIAAPGWAVANQQQSPGTPDQQQAGQTMHEQQTQAGSAIASQGIYGKTPQQLRSMEVLGSAGHEVGTLKDIVADREEGKVCAVISVGGIMGIGAKEVVVPLDQLQLRGEKLHVLASKDDLTNREAYEADLYREVRPADQPISEFSAFETKQPEGSSE